MSTTVHSNTHPFLDSDDSKSRIQSIGHRGYIGGGKPETWYGIGLLQYYFLVHQGLKHENNFLDIGCGSLRLGQFLIPYLNSGNYYGIDAERELIDIALEKEIPAFIIEQKAPNFSVNYSFDFSFIDHFDFAIAQSVFTHLTLDDISICFRNLQKVASKQSKFFFTFFEGQSSKNKLEASHANRNWEYSFSELSNAATNNGWELSYIGSWNHPRNQKMVVAKIGSKQGW